jgi:hypothetical protein
LGDWNFEFAQLTSDKFSVNGAVLHVDGVSVARISMDRTLLHRGSAPRGMVAVTIPGAGSGRAYVQGQLLSQFAMDYQPFFGETPTESRRRSLATDVETAETVN